MKKTKGRRIKKKVQKRDGSGVLTLRRPQKNLQPANLQPTKRSLEDFVPTEIEKAKPGSIVIAQGGKIRHTDNDGKEKISLWGYHTLRIWPSRKANKVLAQTPWLTMVELEPCFPVVLTPLKNFHYVNSIICGEKISTDIEPPTEYLQTLIRLDEEIDQKKIAEAKRSRGGRPPKDSQEKRVDWDKINKGKVDKKFQKEQLLKLLQSKEEVTLEEIISLINTDKRKLTWLIKGLVKDGHRVKEEKGKYTLIPNRRKDGS